MVQKVSRLIFLIITFNIAHKIAPNLASGLSDECTTTRFKTVHFTGCVRSLACNVERYTHCDKIAGSVRTHQVK